MQYKAWYYLYQALKWSNESVHLLHSAKNLDESKIFKKNNVCSFGHISLINNHIHKMLADRTYYADTRVFQNHLFCIIHSERAWSKTSTSTKSKMAAHSRRFARRKKIQKFNKTRVLKTLSRLKKKNLNIFKQIFTKKANQILNHTGDITGFPVQFNTLFNLFHTPLRKISSQ